MDIASSQPGSATAAQESVITLGGGCFWCTEAAFEQLQGVSDVTSGYAGGAKETANYKRVCSGDTGHAEVIRVTYDPAVISLDTLLSVFFDAHDPTTQYRSAIFYADETEKSAAVAKIKELTEKKHFPAPIVTTLEPLVEFFPAEDYHQDYAQQHLDQPYIQSAAIPKACKIRAKYADLIQRN